MESVMVPTKAREYELDWLRVLTVVAVFVQHTQSPYTGWAAIKNDEVSPLIQLLNVISAGLRMPLMFFVAGVACMIGVARRPVGGYVRDRAVKLAIPLLVGLVVLVPVQLLAIAAAEGSLRSGNLLATVSPFRPDGSIVFTHLWFLQHLIVATALLLPALVWLRRVAPDMDARLNGHPAILIGLGTIPLAAQCVRTSWVEYLALSRIIDLRILAASVAYVACGAVVASLPACGEAATRYRRYSLTVWLALGSAGLGLQSVDAAWAPYAAMLVGAAGTWAWVLAAYGYARQYLRSGSPILSSLAESSYAFYLLHYPIFVAMAVIVTPWRLPIAIEWPLLAAMTLALTTTACALARRNPLTRYAFGLRERRQRPRPGVPATVPGASLHGGMLTPAAVVASVDDSDAGTPATVLASVAIYPTAAGGRDAVADQRRSR
jgi:peptidoglycan/LPS O-acetylase OafA/YrhL